MSRYDYDFSMELVEIDPPFYGLVMAAMRRADPYNLRQLREGFPGIWEEMRMRYDAPDGAIKGDIGYEEEQ